MIGIIIALVIALGVGGTVVADTARPGDLLFPVDQAVESIRLSLTGDDKKNELRIKFSEERISEIEDLVGESVDESIDDDEDSLSIEEQKNVTVGIEAVLNLLAQLKEQEQGDSRIDSIATKLNEYIANLPSDVRIEVGEDKLHIKFEDEDEGGDDSKEVEIKDNSKNGTVKTEIRTDEGRIKIEVKNGVLEIKTKLDDDSDDDKDEDANDKDSEDGLEEIEAKILSDKTVVEIELNDEKTTFTTSATSREAIIAAIMAKFPSLTSAEITAVLKIEAEDDSSTEDEDSDKDEDSDSDDNKEQDDDQSDSNSGSDDSR